MSFDFKRAIQVTGAPPDDDPPETREILVILPHTRAPVGKGPSPFSTAKHIERAVPDGLRDDLRDAATVPRGPDDMTTTPKNLYGRKGPINRGDDPLLVKIGKRVRELREREGWTQEQLAEKAERSQVWVSRIERGHYDAPLSSFALLARKLRTTLVALVS